MRLTPTTRLVAVSVMLAAATAILWWLVGLPIGRALLDGAPVWTRTFGYGTPALVQLLALAITVPFTAAVVSSVSPQARWLAIGAVALGAALLYGAQDRADVVALVLFVLAAAAVEETNGAQQAIAAAAISVLVAFAAIADLTLGTSQKIFAVLVRAIFYYAPLLLGPTYLERGVLKRLSR